jgi:hypothetical protein
MRAEPVDAPFDKLRAHVADAATGDNATLAARRVGSGIDERSRI